MADVAALTGDQAHLSAISAIWGNVVGRKLHLSGGVGARAAGEAYGADYELPHKCYNETCAAIAFLMWNHRMFLLSGESKYMDVFERTLYNGFLSGVSLSGDRFFYPNPLEHDGKTKNNHGHAGRAPWFGCACCPPNVMRTLASLTGYFNAVRADRLYVNLYAQSEAQAQVNGVKVSLAQETDYPWNGTVRLRIKPEKAATFTLALRIPGWVSGRPVPGDLYSYLNDAPAPWSVKVDGARLEVQPENGYVLLQRDWKAETIVSLDFPMPVRRVVGNPAVEATRNQVALERGPILYCLEGVDHPDLSVFETWLPDEARIETAANKEVLEGVTTLSITGAQQAQRGVDQTIESHPVNLTAIPYFTWNNRGLSPMRTWFPRNAEGTRQGPLPTIASQSKVTVSFSRKEMDPGCLNDQLLPENATDSFASNFNFWPRKGTEEWMQYDFKTPQTVSGVSIQWFDDTGRGECRVPASWKLLFQADDGSWKPVEGVAAYPTEKEVLHRVGFTPVKTGALRIGVQLQPRFSAGALEWMVK